jgi:hypothetical protein
MARIELRNCTVRVKDGLSGTGAINEPATAPVETDTNFDIDTIVLNTADTDLIPIGARFTVAGETVATTVHTVTARTPAGTSPTTNIVFTPALGAGTYVDGGVVTFLPQQIEIKVGDGEIKYTEASEYKYDKDRGNLDTVREGDEQPMDVSMNFTFEHVKTGTGEVITPIDAIKGINGAVEWVTSSSDPCEPYSVGVEVEHVPPCGSAEKETILFPDFRSEKRDYDFKNAAIAVSGKCNATEPTITRG